MDADAGVAGEVGEAVVIGLDRDLAGPRVVGDAVAGHVAVGAGGAVTRDAAEHDGRVYLLHFLERKAALSECAGAHGLDDAVGALDHVEVDLDAFGLAEVEGDRLLAPIDVQRQERVLAVAVARLHDRPGHLAAVVALGRFDLDDLGAEISEQPAELGRAEHRALDYAYASEQCFVGHRPPLISNLNRAEDYRSLPTLSDAASGWVEGAVR